MIGLASTAATAVLYALFRSWSPPLMANLGALVLVNLLPLTNETRRILNAKLFNRMRRGGYLIQVGRGEHLVEEDLLSALESGQLAGAALDVFGIEPLPATRRLAAESPPVFGSKVTDTVQLPPAASAVQTLAPAARRP